MTKTSDYFDLDSEYKDWEPFVINKANVKKNKGALLLYVNKRAIDPYRGYFSIDRADDIVETYYSNLIFDGGSNNVDFRDIVACIIKKETKK